MAAKRKIHHLPTRSSRVGHGAVDPARQLASARRAYAKGMMCAEDYIWAAMQCYAADSRTLHKS